MSRIYVGIFAAFLLFNCSLKTHAQTVDLVLKVADDLFEQKDYYGSIQFYEKAMEIDSNNAEVLYKYARNLSLTNQHEKSSRYYQKALILDRSDEFPMCAYYLAEAYRSSGDYRKARRYYNQAMRPYRSDRDSYWYKRIDQNKDAAAWASKNDSETGANPSNLTKKVNSSFSEFAPTIHEKTLYYSAMIADSVLTNNRIKDKQFLSRIYWKSLAEEKEAQELKLSTALENQFKNLHLANPSFFENDIYFSVCDSNFICQIWKGQLVNNKLTKAVELNKNINHPTSNNTQAVPTLIDGELYLFFTSNRPGGEGELDLYMAKEASFGFDQALNLGPIVNTPGNEITPFYDAPSQTLFFSSDWHLGFGGYDIFKSVGEPIDFESSENLGYGINTFSNDYYFKAFHPIALLTSNRKEGNVDAQNDCCNDLYETSYQLDSVLAVATETTEHEVTTKIVNIDVLNNYLPTELYFHNDEPNPNSRKTSTNKNYMNLAKAYSNMRESYLSTYVDHVPRKERTQAESDLNHFFDEELQHGVEQLEEFTPLLLKELKKGSKIELTVRGFASALSETEYNINLTYRRIESLINYFEQAENGAFVPYISGNASNGGSLSFNKIPYGEYAVAQQIDVHDKVAAVYSPQAAAERKIELIAVSNSNKSSGITTEEAAKITFNTQNYELGVIRDQKVISRFFKVNNTGKGELKLYNISSNCECVSLDYPKTIKSGGEGKILIDVDTEKLSGNVSIELLVVSNTDPNLNRLTIEFELE